MIRIFKATAVVSVATIANIFIGVIRAKFTAVTLGPAGVGVFSQAMNFLQFAITLSSLCIGLGVTKYVSQYNSEGDMGRVEKVISSAVWLQVIASLVFVLFIFLFSGALSKFLFSTGIYSLFLFIASIGIPFAVLSMTSETILFGFGNYKSFTLGKTISIVSALLPLFIFIYLMKLDGGFIYIAVNSILTFAIFYWILARSMPENLMAGFFKFRGVKKMLDKTIVKDLLGYGGASFVTTAMNLLMIVVLRALVIRYFGADGNGFYQVVFAISSYYLPFFTNGIWTYFYPKLSAVKENSKEYGVEINNIIRFCILFITPAIIGIFLMRDILIRLVFSEEFSRASGLFSTQLFGDMFFVIFYILGTSLLASARLKAYIGLGLGYSISFIGLFLIQHEILGLKSITVSYLITNVFWVILLLLFHILRMKVVFYARNIILLVSSAVLILVCLNMGGSTLQNFIIKMSAVLIWDISVLTSIEKKKAMAMASAYIKRFYEK